MLNYKIIALKFYDSKKRKTMDIGVRHRKIDRRYLFTWVYNFATEFMEHFLKVIIYFIFLY